LVFAKHAVNSSRAYVSDSDVCVGVIDNTLHMTLTWLQNTGWCMKGYLKPKGTSKNWAHQTKLNQIAAAGMLTVTAIYVITENLFIKAWP